MSVLLCVIFLIWLAFVQQKLDKVERNLACLIKEIYKPQNNDVKISEPKGILASEPVTEIMSEQEMVKEVEVAEETSEVEPSTQIIDKTLVKKDDFSLQNAFLGNIFNKIGAIAIIIAVIIFIKLVSPFIVITPLMKVIFGCLAGVGMIGGALYLHTKENMMNYSEVLLGTGFADLFITTFCAYSMFHLIGTAAVITVGALLLLITFILAQRMQTVSMLVIGLAGGYLTPCFSGASYEVCMWYLIFLNAVSLIYTLKNQRFCSINIINLVITMLAFMPYVIEPAKPILPIALWAIYIVYDLLRDKSSKLGYAVSVVNYAVLTIFSMILFRTSQVYFGCMLGVAALVYYVMAYCSYVAKNEIYKTYVYYILLNIWLVILFLLNDIYSVAIFSIIGFALAVFVGKFNRKYLSTAMQGYFFTAFAGALLAKSGSDLCMFAHYSPILNIRTLVFGIPIAAMLSAAFMLKKEHQNTSNLLKFSGISLGYLYLVGEVNSLFAQVASAEDFNKWMLYLMIGFVYSVHTKKLYMQNNYVLFEVASCFLYIISLFLLLCGSYTYPQGYLP
ncbi:MAG: DUF2339 domain-containing protein, partial [Candidatus Gastranaerophilales bacterium]|nr:DUF2339 domain-containing protein [Candidatus Gastranaerophilales bacterium]